MSVAALIAACHSAPCAPPPAGTGGSLKSKSSGRLTATPPRRRPAAPKQDWSPGVKALLSEKIRIVKGTAKRAANPQAMPGDPKEHPDGQLWHGDGKAKNAGSLRNDVEVMVERYRKMHGRAPSAGAIAKLRRNLKTGRSTVPQAA